MSGRNKKETCKEQVLKCRCIVKERPLPPTKPKVEIIDVEKIEKETKPKERCYEQVMKCRRIIKERDLPIVQNYKNDCCTDLNFDDPELQDLTLKKCGVSGTTKETTSPSEKYTFDDDNVIHDAESNTQYAPPSSKPRPRPIPRPRPRPNTDYYDEPSIYEYPSDNDYSERRRRARREAEAYRLYLLRRHLYR